MASLWKRIIVQCQISDRHMREVPSRTIRSNIAVGASCLRRSRQNCALCSLGKHHLLMTFIFGRHWRADWASALLNFPSVVLVALAFSFLILFRTARYLLTTIGGLGTTITPKRGHLSTLLTWVHYPRPTSTCSVRLSASGICGGSSLGSRGSSKIS